MCGAVIDAVSVKLKMRYSTEEKQKIIPPSMIHNIFSS